MSKFKKYTEELTPASIGEIAMGRESLDLNEIKDGFYLVSDGVEKLIEEFSRIGNKQGEKIALKMRAVTNEIYDYVGGI